MTRVSQSHGNQLDMAQVFWTASLMQTGQPLRQGLKNKVCIVATVNMMSRP